MRRLDLELYIEKMRFLFSIRHCIFILGLQILGIWIASSDTFYTVIAESSFRFWGKKGKHTPPAFAKISPRSIFDENKKKHGGKQDLVVLLRGGSSLSDSESEDEYELPALIEENDDEPSNIELNLDKISSLPGDDDDDDDEDEYETFPLTTSESQDDESIASIEEPNEIDASPEQESNVESAEENENDEDSMASKERKARKENRHTSDVILELDRRSSVSGNDESLALRQLITTRTSEYVYELQEETERYLQEQEAGSNVKLRLPHPRRLLHSLAKNVPAIKQSPDVNLRIHSSRSDIDPGVAACIIGRLAFACEHYEQVQKRLTNEYFDPSSYNEEDDSEQADADTTNTGNKDESAASQLTTDRRFEQLVECVISGVNIKKRKMEALERSIKTSTDEITTDIEEVLDEEENQLDEGLNIRDGCRAAWGIAILGAHYQDTLGGVKISDLLLALSLRIRELLLARLQLLRQGDILSSGYGMYRQDYDDPSQQRQLVTIDERMDELAEELAEDAASAMWAFGCVKACTGMKSVPLFEACSSILCQDPVDLRRRAQEAEYEPEENPDAIGSSDVVDRLALSEAAEANEDEFQPEETSTRTEMENEIETLSQNMEGKDAFIDWLSPVEVTDMLWALALHGSNATSSQDKDEVTLSETASTLRETAYDRLVDWLDDDLNYKEEEQSNSEAPFTNTESPEDEEGTVVEVVDAATLLASEADSSISPQSSSPSAMQSLDVSEEIDTVPTESMEMKTSSIVNNDINMQEVEVVDAAALLASMDSDNHEAVPVETEVMQAPTSMIEGSSISNDVDVSSGIEERKNTRIFTPHDLASIAWSVTELRDPLRIHIVGTIIELLWRLGPDGIAALSGTDLSNLAWAIAKYEGENHDAYSLSITRWIADQALQRTKNNPLLGIFQPPELGRIMWAIALTASTHASALEDAKGHSTSSIFLTRQALKAVSENLTLFSTETLVRIAWAHLEINESDLSALNSFETMALGKILAAAEHSLHRWERVDFAKDVASAESQAEIPLFSTFFGRSRINLPILEQAINDDDDDDDLSLAPLGRSQRPKLRDLMIDPSTLCKAACGFQRLSNEHPHIKGGWTLTRVAVRLLSSKNASLMKECSIHDIVRLCEAAVLSDVDGHGRELIIGLFARQVVKVLNEVLDEENNHSTSIDIETASSTEISTLIWTLGEMGAKYSPGKHTSGKKMRLGFAEPLLRRIRVTSLDHVALERLIRGLVLMKMTSSHESFILEVLLKISEKIPNVATGSELCTLAEAIGILKEASKSNSAKEEESIDEEINEEAENEETSEAEDVQEKINSISEQILNSIAALIIDRAETLTANEIRRLLEVYSLLPFQADEMISCLSNEVSNRLEVLSDLQDDQPLSNLMDDASQKSSVVKTSLFDETNTSVFESMKVKFFSFFSSSNKEDSDDEVVNEVNDEGANLTEEIASAIQDSISATREVSKRAKTYQTALHVPLDMIIQNQMEGAAFELGRSLELIENYHRTEFSTGERRSRYDRNRKNYIAKRVLSRLLP